jgi:hypothetical protein
LEVDSFVVLLQVDGLLELVDFAGFLSQLEVLLVFGLHVDALLLVAGLVLISFGLHVEVLLVAGLQVGVLLVAGFAQVEVLLLVAGLVLFVGSQLEVLLLDIGLLVVEDLSVVGLHVDDLQDPFAEFPVSEDPALVGSDTTGPELTEPEFTESPAVGEIIVVLPVGSVVEMPRLLKSIGFESPDASEKSAR